MVSVNESIVLSNQLPKHWFEWTKNMWCIKIHTISFCLFSKVLSLNFHLFFSQSLNPHQELMRILSLQRFSFLLTLNILQRPKYSLNINNIHNISNGDDDKRTNKTWFRIETVSRLIVYRSKKKKRKSNELLRYISTWMVWWWGHSTHALDRSVMRDVLLFRLCWWRHCYTVEPMHSSWLFPLWSHAIHDVAVRCRNVLP